MRAYSISVGMAVTILTVFALPSALPAHDAKSPSGEGSSPARPGMRMEGMDKMMDHCMRMMQGRSIRPNDQWRDSPPPANGAKKP